jgi:hypothetical protein
MIAPVKPHWDFSFEQDIGDTGPATRKDIDYSPNACPSAREVNNVRFLEQVQEFGMNIIGACPFATEVQSLEGAQELAGNIIRRPQTCPQLNQSIN